MVRNYKLIFCDSCGEETSHVSNNDDDFYCLVCFDKDANKEADKQNEERYYSFTDRESDLAHGLFDQI